MTMEKPLIGLTSSRMPNPSGRPAFGVNLPYTRSIAQAGGLPVLIPINLSMDNLDVLLPRLDGILFTGGDDIDPQEYGAQPHAKVEGIDVERDQLELHLVQAVIRAGKPYLGICRGCQVINVALGGSLYADLTEQYPGAIQHDQHGLPRDTLAHGIDINPDSLLAQILQGATTRVNSLHHQGVRKLAQLLRASAFAPDGLVEAFELPNHPFGVAVQWHPEELPKHAAMRRLFQAFVHACEQVKSNPIKQEIT